MTGKIVPYVMIGLVQVTLVLVLARLIFNVPMQGNLGVLYLAVLLFIAANLTLGLTFSSIARNQLQAMQMTFFFFLPSMLLSGFMFPFRGMPGWAQAIGEVLPLTHFLRIVRGVLLKGNAIADVLSETWPIVAFMTVVLLIGLRTFKSTLDWTPAAPGNMPACRRIHSTGGRHDGIAGEIRPFAAAGDHRRRSGRLDRPHASDGRRNGRLVPRDGRRGVERSGGARAAGVAVGLDPARSYGDVAEMLAKERERRRPHRCGRHHDVERHALPVLRRGARRRARCRLRQAGHAQFRRGLRPRRPDPPARADLRDRARLFRLSDDPLCPAARARRRDRHDPPGPGRVHPERPRDAPRGWAAEQSPALGARSRAERAGAGDERDRLSCAASRVLRVGPCRRRGSRPTSAR